METVGVDVDSVSRGASLPQFLKPWQPSQRSTTHAAVPVRAVYTHKHKFGHAQVLWWPVGTQAHDSKVVPRTVLLFIPGNPGLLDFYVPFLDEVDRRVRASPSSSSSSSLSSGVTIFAHSHLGLSSYIQVGADSDSDSKSSSSSSSYPETSNVALTAQIQAHLEFLDELLVAYGPTTRVLLVGHSIGSWLIQEILKARADALRPRVGAYMLFPTISHIIRTPNGKKLSPFFRPPWPRRLAYLSHLTKYVIPLPLWIFGLLQPSWPRNQLQVLHDFLRAPAAIYAALTMANDEMETVRELDKDFLREFAHNLWFYYAEEEEDGWVGEQRAVVLRALCGTPAESHVALGQAGIPHAFCINHSAEVASQCVEWMRTGGFLGDLRT